MKRYRLLKNLLLSILALTALQAAAQSLPENATVPAHPRLLLLRGEEKAIATNLKSDPQWQKLHSRILAVCDATLQEPPVQHIKIGRRLLDKSRTCLQRVFYLAYTYRLTGQEKYATRAEQEMLAVAAFSDWNPSHFLDVGEMTMALSIGYDWLYDRLSPSSRKIISEAILKNGIEPSLDSANNSWLRSTNNWNQVCNAGITYGAIATYEDHPALSRQLVNRAIAAVALPMQEYAPDGNYPEGYMYWEYGTSFNVMLVTALQSTFGNDFGLSRKPGFLQTPVFLENLVGTSGRPFNYADCINRAQFNPAVFWFAAQTKNPQLLWVEKKSITEGDSLNNRLLPAALIWGRQLNLKGITAPTNHTWVSGGVNPVALLRTSWTAPNAIFVGFKGGSPSGSHAHMDAGSFVMDADGERWAMDFGMQEYESLESKGLSIWNMGQNSDRWKVFRYNNLAHNTLAVNGSLQQVKGMVTITGYSSRPTFLSAVATLTPVYDSGLQKAERGVAIVDEKYVVIQDEIKTKAAPATIRWSMVTPATVNILNDSTAELTQHGKRLLLKTTLPYKAPLKTWSTAPATTYDAPNPGTVIIGFEMPLPANSGATLSVFLEPQATNSVVKKPLPPLVNWPGEKVEPHPRPLSTARP